MTTTTVTLHTLGLDTGHRGACRGHLAGLDAEPRRAEAQPGALGLPSRRKLRDAMYTQTFAEEDCEEPIVRTLLGLGDDREREMALKVAGYFDRYAPALPYLRDCPPGIHYHAIAFSGGLCTDPFGRFDTKHRGRVLRGRRRDGSGLR